MQISEDSPERELEPAQYYFDTFTALLNAFGIEGEPSEDNFDPIWNIMNDLLSRGYERGKLVARPNPKAFF